MEPGKRGIKHDFPFINNDKVPRKVLKEEGQARGPSLIMFDRYYCIISTKHCKNAENIGALYWCWVLPTGGSLETKL